MTERQSHTPKFSGITRLLHTGRKPEEQFGFVNTPVYHGSTVLYPSYDAIKNKAQKYVYGRVLNPTSESLQNTVAELEGGYRSVLCPSGLSAITSMMLSVLKSGDHVLVTDSTYRPARVFCDGFLTDIGIEVTYYDPLIGSDIGSLMKPNTRLVYTECPGSQTMEMQDIPAIAGVAHEHGALVAADNTWSAGHYFKPLEHGCDISVQAGTKYLVGHSDVMMGVITVSEPLWEEFHGKYSLLGQTAGPDDAYLTLRGVRTLDVRLERHMQNALEMANWLEARDEVAQVLHPALPSHPGHDIWRRDFTGSSGLFSMILKPVPETAVAAFFNALSLFGMGYSWGGFESLAIPFNPSDYRSATTWDLEGQAVRFHIGLESPEDLKSDLDAAFHAMNAAI